MASRREFVSPSTLINGSLPLVDATHCITRTDNVLGTSTKSSSQPVHFRSSRIPIPKQNLLSKITAIVAENGISISRLVMPTKPNIERMEALQVAAAGLLDMKKNVDRVEQEIRTLKVQRDAVEGSEIPDQSEEAGDGNKHLVSPDVPKIGPYADIERSQSNVRKRSMSISSNATSTTTRTTNKRARRD